MILVKIIIYQILLFHLSYCVEYKLYVSTGNPINCTYERQLALQCSKKTNCVGFSITDFSNTQIYNVLRSPTTFPIYFVAELYDLYMMIVKRNNAIAGTIELNSDNYRTQLLNYVCFMSLRTQWDRPIETHIGTDSFYINHYNYFRGFRTMALMVRFQKFLKCENIVLLLYALTNKGRISVKCNHLQIHDDKRISCKVSENEVYDGRFILWEADSLNYNLCSIINCDWFGLDSILRESSSLTMTGSIYCPNMSAG